MLQTIGLISQTDTPDPLMYTLVITKALAYDTKVSIIGHTTTSIITKMTVPKKYFFIILLP